MLKPEFPLFDFRTVMDNDTAILLNDALLNMMSDWIIQLNSNTPSQTLSNTLNTQTEPNSTEHWSF